MMWIINYANILTFITLTYPSHFLTTCDLINLLPLHPNLFFSIFMHSNMNSRFSSLSLSLSLFFFFLKMSSQLMHNQFFLSINFKLYIIIKKSNINVYVFVLIFILFNRCKYIYFLYII